MTDDDARRDVLFLLHDVARLIRVEAESAEYWDTPTSAVVYAFGYLKALATGKPSHAGEVGTVALA